ncbi:unnamed protein product, partial [Aphanomyces euteiches]
SAGTEVLCSVCEMGPQNSDHPWKTTRGTNHDHFLASTFHSSTEYTRNTDQQMANDDQ